MVTNFAIGTPGDRMHARFRLHKVSAVAALMLALSTPMVSAHGEEARDVVLRMKGGGFQVAGALRAFDGVKYVIESPQFGRLTLQAARYECIGAACTSPIATAAWSQETLSPDRPETFAIRGTDLLTHHLMPAMIRGFATEINAEATQIIGTRPGELRYRLVDAGGRELAVIDLVRDETAAALAALEKGTTAIALADRPATPQEADAIAAAQPKLKTAQHEHLLGLDGIAVIVAPDHPLSSLPLDTIAKIFAGQLTDWYELGLPPGPIKIIAREASQNTLARFEALVLKPRNLALTASMERAASEAALADAVARDRNAIGLVSFAVTRSAKAVNLETSCGLNLRPTPFAVKAGEYPLSQRLYLYAAAPPKQAAARGLLRFVTSGDAQLPAADGPFIGLGIDAVTLAEQSERMAHAINAQGEAFDLFHMRAMLADLKGGRRLSMTFRFTPGTLDLDARSRLDVSRLAALLQVPETAGKRLLLAGFTDATGAKFQANVVSAAKRAAQVRTALLAAGGTRLDHRLVVAKGYGPLAPVACNDTVEGQRLNRRVEVWLRD